MQNKLNRIFEYLWLLTGILSMAAGVHKSSEEGISNSYIFFALAVICMIVYSIRRNIRLKKKR